MLVPYDTCQCCLGRSARLRKTGEVFCDECWSFYPEEEEGEPDYVDEPPWANDTPHPPTGAIEMAEMKFTPGPWLVSDLSSDDDGTIVYAADPVYGESNVCDVLSMKRAAADAALIASAPDLYEALNGMVGLVQLLLARPEFTENAREVVEGNHRLTAARAALSRATGKE